MTPVHLFLAVGTLASSIVFVAPHIPTIPGLSPETTCRQYESDGAIPAGSCDCSAKLFPDWNQSYDWKDACMIVKEKAL